ncbi:hypothetical protein BC830DRAFT_1165303 [Chytriomyces sp. MP71]|nr:hypothetical protein BC830DRAFT_1165303 [Chytriomyces sp. MP71]
MLLALPHEVAAQILSHTNARDTLRIEATCSQLRHLSIAFASMVWKSKTRDGAWDASPIQPRRRESHRDIAIRQRCLGRLRGNSSTRSFKRFDSACAHLDIPAGASITLCYADNEPFSMHWLSETVLLLREIPVAAKADLMFSYQNPLSESLSTAPKRIGRPIHSQPMRDVKNSDWLVGWTGDKKDTYILYAWNADSNELCAVAPNPFDNVHLLFEYSEAMDDVEVMGCGDLIVFYHQAVNRETGLLCVELVAFQHHHPTSTSHSESLPSLAESAAFKRSWSRLIPMRCLGRVQMNSQFISIAAISKSWPADHIDSTLAPASLADVDEDEELESLLKIDVTILSAATGLSILPQPLSVVHPVRFSWDGFHDCLLMTRFHLLLFVDTWLQVYDIHSLTPCGGVYDLGFTGYEKLVSPDGSKIGLWSQTEGFRVIDSLSQEDVTYSIPGSSKGPHLWIMYENSQVECHKLASAV